jgi:hypothetical protein
VSRSFALSLACLLSLGSLSTGCDKKKSEEPTRGDTDAGAEGVVVEEPGVEPGEAEGAAESPVDPIGNDELEYEGSVEVVAGDVPCATDADCVPTECCHPSSCGAVATKQDCSATMCTLECRSGTMDCFGGCLCGEDKKCAAKIWTASPT